MASVSCRATIVCIIRRDFGADRIESIDGFEILDLALVNTESYTHVVVCKNGQIVVGYMGSRFHVTKHSVAEGDAGAVARPSGRACWVMKQEPQDVSGRSINSFTVWVGR